MSGYIHHYRLDMIHVMSSHLQCAKYPRVCVDHSFDDLTIDFTRTFVGTDGYVIVVDVATWHGDLKGRIIFMKF